jgi:hypothetical protein
LCANNAALPAADDCSGFHHSGLFLFWLARRAAVPADDFVSMPTTGKLGRSEAFAYFRLVAAPTCVRHDAVI